MEWYYADGQEKRGPLSADEIQTLIAANRIQPATLVWNASLTQWTTAREAGLIPGTPAEPATQTCLVTGKIFPVSQMIKTQHGWVSAEGKDRYYQSLRENAPIPTAPGMTNARRSGRKIVIPVNGGQLPSRCVKTGEPVTESQMKTKTLYWCTPWAALSILLNLIVYLILYLALRKKVIVAIPMSQAGRTILRKHAFVAIGLAVGGIALTVVGFINLDRFGWLPFVGILLLLVGLIYGLIKANALRVSKIANGEAWLTGACTEFLSTLPEY